MTVASASPAIMTQLLELLPPVLAAITRPAGFAVEIHDGWPGDVIQTDVVILGDHTIEQDEASLGMRSRREDVTIEVEILGTRNGGTASEVREAVFEIADALMTWARTAPGFTAGGTSCSLLLYPIEYKAGIGDHARSGWLRCTLKAHNARL